MLDDFKEKSRGITFKKGDVVEVLDMEKTEEWLVRKQADKEAVSLNQLISP